MNNIHNNNVNIIAECNLLYDILYLYKHNNNNNYHYSHILLGCMNKRRGKEKYKMFIFC